MNPIRLIILAGFLRALPASCPASYKGRNPYRRMAIDHGVAEEAEIVRARSGNPEPTLFLHVFADVPGWVPSVASA
jgi:hypothetical protein